MTYSEKLQDPRWQKKRLNVLELDDYTCQLCGSTTKSLQVHHKYYIHGLNPWEYDVKTLTTLCADCHQLEGDMKKEYEPKLLRAIYDAGFTAADIGELVKGFGDMELQDKSFKVAQAYNYALTTPDLQKQILEWFYKRVEDIKNSGL